MINSILFFVFVLSFYGVLEYYGWQAVKTITSPKHLKLAAWIYWGVAISVFALFVLNRPFLHKYMNREMSSYFGVLFMILLLSKFIVLLFLLPGDVWGGLKSIVAKFSPPTYPSAEGAIPRSEFLSRIALLTAAVPAGTLVYGVIANAYNYQFHRTTIKFPNLPKAFDGFKIIQLSDIHAGSFTRTEPVEKVVAQINALNPDLILFTGDLVNNVATEMDPYIDIFGQLKAKHGVFSITGNHDYGDYVQWDTPEEKAANFEAFKAVHQKMGWNLLLNENRTIEQGGETITLLGIENWGGGRFAKYGKFEQAVKGTENAPFKIMMSHDPSSWDMRIRTEFPDIDLTLSGHTHGAQFGIENKWLKWSPSQYIYKQWAGLYNEGKQFLYVNRGFGFLGYPGRVGILPEVAEITLKRA